MNIKKNDQGGGWGIFESRWWRGKKMMKKGFSILFYYYYCWIQVWRKKKDDERVLKDFLSFSHSKTFSSSTKLLLVNASHWSSFSRTYHGSPSPKIDGGYWRWFLKFLKLFTLNYLIGNSWEISNFETVHSNFANSWISG